MSTYLCCHFELVSAPGCCDVIRCWFCCFPASLVNRMANGNIQNARWCNVANVGAMFWKQSTGLALPSYNTVGLIRDGLKTNDQNQYSRTRQIFSPYILLAFPNLAPTLPTMQLRHWAPSQKAFYQITCNFLWSHSLLVHICSSTSQQCKT